MVYTAKVWHAAAFSCNGLREASALMRISSIKYSEYYSVSGTGNYRYLRDSTYTKGIVKITIF